MKVLVACEESQVVCKAFRERGHEAFSCDQQECSGGRPEWHIQDDVLRVLYVLRNDWDLMIGHPPCTYISYVGTRHWNTPGRLEKRLDALQFFAKLWTAPVPKICLENPRGCASPTIAKYSQSIQPYYFGDEQSKTTWLWLKNLPNLVHSSSNTLFEERTHVERGEMLVFDSGKSLSKWYSDAFRLPPMERARARSKTFPGIAKAMAEQWG